MTRQSFMLARSRLLRTLLVVSVCAACEPPAPPPLEGEWEPIVAPTRIWLVSGDFASDFLTWQTLPTARHRGPSLSLRLEPITPRLDETAMGGLSLERIEGGQRIPVNAKPVRGFVDPSGRGPEPMYEGGYSLVPNEPLEEGWYLFRADLSEVLERGPRNPTIEGPRRGDVLHSRIYIGSRPMWHTLHVGCGPATGSNGRACSYSFILSERIDAQRVYAAAESIRVLYDDIEISCPPLPEGLGDRETTVALHACPEPREGTRVELAMRSELIPDVRGRTDTVVEFVYGEPDVPRTDITPLGDLREATFVPHADFGLGP
jgi:hypothetical protein